MIQKPTTIVALNWFPAVAKAVHRMCRIGSPAAQVTLADRCTEAHHLRFHLLVFAPRHALTMLLATPAMLVVAGIFTVAEPAERAVAPRVIWVPRVEHVQDCSEFYEPYRIRGLGWGSGPGLGVGFGTFEGALPTYPSNSFPNWYGACERWGHYSATGSAR